MQTQVNNSIHFTGLNVADQCRVYSNTIKTLNVINYIFPFWATCDKDKRFPAASMSGVILALDMQHCYYWQYTQMSGLNF